MKKLILLGLLTTAFIQGFSQTKDDWNSITTGQWMLEINPSAFVMLYKLNYFLDLDNSKLTIEDLLKKSNIDPDAQPFSKIKYGANEYLAAKKNPKSDVRLFRILKEKDDFFVLCSSNDDLCDCKENTFIYLKSQQTLQRIEKPFSLSLKNNLLDRLEEYALETPKGIESLEFYQILKVL